MSPLQPLCRWTSAWANRRKRHRKSAHHATKPGPSDFSDAATAGNPTAARAVVPQTRPGIRRILSWLATRTPRPTDGPCGGGGVATDAAPPALHRGTDSRMRNPATPRPTRAWLHRRNPSAERRRGPAFTLPHTGLPRQAGFCALRHGMARRCWTADPIELQYSCWPELGYWHRNPSVFALLMQHIKQAGVRLPSLCKNKPERMCWRQ